MRESSEGMVSRINHLVTVYKGMLTRVMGHFADMTLILKRRLIFLFSPLTDTTILVAPKTVT